MTLLSLLLELGCRPRRFYSGSLCNQWHNSVLFFSLFDKSFDFSKVLLFPNVSKQLLLTFF